LKVVYVSEDFPPVSSGGAGVSTQEMATEIGRHNDVVVFTPSYGETEGMTPAENFRIFRYHNRFVPTGSPIQQKTLFFLEMTKHLSAFVREFAPDIVHAQNLMSAPAVAKISESNSLVGIVHARDHRFECFTSRLACLSHTDATFPDFVRCMGNPWQSLVFPYAKFVTRNIRMALKKCGRAFAVSNYLRAELLRRVSLDVRTSYIGVDLARIDKLKPMKEIRGRALESDKIVVYNGGFYEHKGIFELLEGFRKVRTKFSDALLIIGGKGPKQRAAAQMVKSFSLERNVLFLGSVPHEEMLSVVKAGTFVIVPSLLPEAGSRSAVEALACRRPVLGSNKGCIPEVVGNAGVTFEPDAFNISRAIVSMLGNGQKLQELGEAARAKRRIFDAKRTNMEIVATYNEWLSNPPKPS
jgi:glycosyltransferase involved in cell wall biosynthesis